MTDTNSDKQPTHTIFKVVGNGPEGKWTKVGVGFPHKDGLGLALVFDGIPVEGRIALRKNRPVEATQAEPVPAAQPTLPYVQLPKPRRAVV